MRENIKRCMVCAKPSEQTICESCRAEIQGEALDKKIKIDKQVPLTELPDTKKNKDK